MPSSVAEPPAVEMGCRVTLLGPVSVWRGGQAVELPRSRQCRALIAFLAMTAAPHRRESLCELFWEVPDDPKGALRWSLSKLRPILGAALLTDRESIELRLDPGAIDAAALLASARQAGSVETALLERWATLSHEPFAHGCDLDRSPAFEAWLIGVREDVRRAQFAILSELVERLRATPDRAVEPARRRVALEPFDERSTSEFLELLIGAQRVEEAERQRQLAVRLRKEAMLPVPEAWLRPLRRSAAVTPASPSQLVQSIRFCTAPDGARIAYSRAGAGPPLVKTANWMSHLEHEWESPFLRHWLSEFASRRTLIRYDARGNGLSDRKVDDLSLAAFVGDLEAVTAHMPEAPFDVIGISQGVPVAVAFAAKHPDRVRKLVLFGGFPAGWQHSESKNVHARWEAMITLAGLGWGRDNPAFRQMFTSQFMPKAGAEEAGWFNDLQRASASPEQAQRLLRAMGAFDVRGLLSSVRAPTLVAHSVGDAMVPFDAGRYLAAEIPGARFVSLESENHLPLASEPAWEVFVSHAREFLE